MQEATTAAGSGGSESTAGSSDGGGRQQTAAAESGGDGQTEQTPRGVASRVRTSPNALRASPVRFAVEKNGKREAMCKRCGENIQKEEPRMVQWQKTKGRNGEARYHVLCVTNGVARTIACSAPRVHEQLVEEQLARRAQSEDERRETRAKHGVAKFFLRSAIRKD